MSDPAPATCTAVFETTKGKFTVQVNRDWAPVGADRFVELVKGGVFDGARFFRVLPGFIVQFGIPGDPAVARKWRESRIADDPVKQTNSRGTVTFATAGPNTRTNQVFINLGDNAFLDASGFSPFGQVIEGMDVVEQLFSGYGEGAPQGRGPAQNRIQSEGNAYLEKDFPKLDAVVKASLGA